LPSEAQWEYACRAGTTTPYAFGASLSKRQANIAGSGTTAVGSYPANAWGLQDMHGNVWEWCADDWHPNYHGAPGDGRPWMEASAKLLIPRLLRGGSWINHPRDCRSAFRNDFHPDIRNHYIGFRVCCLPQD
jgi:formylglycine-generating enzyme required for sulfatase activity